MEGKTKCQRWNGGLEPTNPCVDLLAIHGCEYVELLTGLIIESGIADPYERFLAYSDLGTSGFSESELRAETAKFSPKTKLSRYTNPLLILHSENDGLIEMSHAERNYKGSNSAKKRLVRFPKGNHNTILPANLKQYIGAVKEFADGLVL
jgi:fermentation-respiration switch protein FrsA (DUF1100 family)